MNIDTSVKKMAVLVHWYNYFVTLLCKVKKEAERATMARMVLKKIWNRESFKDFVVEFEIKDTFVYEKVYKRRINTLEKMIDFFYGNYFKVFLSGLFPLGFDTDGDVMSYRPRYIKEKIGVFLKDRLSRFVKFYLVFGISSEFHSRSDFIDFKLPGRNHLLPNFGIKLNSIEVSLGLFVEFLKEIKNDLKAKKTDGIYHEIIDVFLESIDELGIQYDDFFFESNIFIRLYYDFRLLFSASGAVKMRFIKFGASWGTAELHGPFEFYLHRLGTGEKYQLTEKIADKIEKKYSLKKEEKRYKIGLILYELSQSIIAYWAKEDTLNKMFLDELWKLVENLIKDSNCLECKKNKKINSIKINENDKNKLILANNKFILNILKKIYEKKSKIQEINYKLEKHFLKLISEGKSGLHAVIKAPSSYELLISMSYYDPKSQKDTEIIEIGIRVGGITDGEYELEIKIHPLFYNLDENEVGKICWDQSIFILFESLDFSKHDLYLFLKKIEAEFSPIDF